MRNFLLFSIFIFGCFAANTQIISGNKLTANIKGKDIKGNDFDIFADLDAGKSVIIDVFATWCSPCWNFHNNGIFKSLNNEFGPNGTDQIRVYGLEADPSTPLDHLFKKVEGNPTSLGDWTAGVDYPIINNHSFNSILKISYFPTLYVIRPDRTVMEMGGFRNNYGIWEKAMIPAAEKDLIFTDAIVETSFCNSAIFTQHPNIINMGTTSISSLKASISFNEEKNSVSFSTPLGVFKQEKLDFGTKQVDNTTEVRIKIEEVDDIKDAEDNLSEIAGTLYRPSITDKSFTVLFTTDFYPSQTSWIITDQNDRVIHNQSTYRAGNEDRLGGGGPEANKEFRYELTIEDDDVTCLTMTINDNHKNGMRNFDNNHPVPGVVFLNSAGEVIKEKIYTDFIFDSSTKQFISVDLTSSLQDQPFVEFLNVYPNPVTDILNVELQIRDGVDYQLFVTDLMGKQVSDISNNANFINVANLSSGMYFLNLRTKGGIYTHKFNKIY